MVREVIGNFCLSDCLRLGRTWIEATSASLRSSRWTSKREACKHIVLLEGMKMIHFLVHDAADNVGVAVVDWSQARIASEETLLTTPA